MKTATDHNAITFITAAQRHPFNGLSSTTIWVSQHQKAYTNVDFNEAREDGWPWHQLDHMQIVCTSLQIDNHASTSSINFL